MTKTRRTFLGAAAAALSLSVSASGTAASETGTKEGRTVYDGDVGPDPDAPVPFVQLRGEGGQSTVFGAGAEVTVRVVDGELQLEATADLEEPGRLLDRDILHVGLSGKDLPEDNL